jgi:hypothetical protein
VKFLCDVMLARVARWLRAAGYDTALAEVKVLDKELLARAIKEERLKDRRFKHVSPFLPGGRGTHAWSPFWYFS